MSLPRTTDAAAKQILDSTRVFREYARVRKECDGVKGSLFWKKVGPYEYLAQKVQGKVTYIGPRGPETERGFEEFKARKAQLQQRVRKLKATVESSQRMNKAVRAGAVPKQVVDVLHELEATGLGEGSVVLGTPALYAYGQPAGVRLEAVSSPVHGSIVEDAKHHLQVLVHAPEHAVKAALPGLREAVDAKVDIAAAGTSGDRSYFLIEFKFVRSRAVLSSGVKDAYWRKVATRMAATVEYAAKFEQVVIGKTGTMATMRTLDPKFFVMMNHAAAHAGAPAVQDPEAVQWQAEVVDSLVTESLVLPKLPESECRRAVDEIAQRVFAHG